MKILIVEDEVVSQKVLVKQLSSYGDCTVVDTGQKAIDTIRQAFMEERPFDLVLLDILIPEPNGQEVLQVLREIEASRDIGFEDNVKVIMTSSLDDPMNVVTAFQHGCEGYVTKPFKKEHLEAEMRKVGLL